MDMPRLLVLRHAKSNWANAYQSDFDRTLAPRGVRAAATVADHIAALGAPPALVLCSTALRAQETLEPLRDRLPAGTEVRLEDGLYGADVADLLARLRQVPEDVESVLLVGHNPGLEDLVLTLARAGDGELLARVRMKFPTAALATLTFDGSWPQLGSGPARLDSFVVPGELE